jgi:hypothetical protein
VGSNQQTPFFNFFVGLSNSSVVIFFKHTQYNMFRRPPVSYTTTTSYQMLEDLASDVIIQPRELKRKKYQVPEVLVVDTDDERDHGDGDDDLIEFTDIDSDDEERLQKKMKSSNDEITSTQILSSSPDNLIFETEFPQPQPLCHECHQPATHGAVHAPKKFDSYAVVHQCWCTMCAVKFQCSEKTSCPCCREFVLFVSKIIF